MNCFVLYSNGKTCYRLQDIKWCNVSIRNTEQDDCDETIGLALFNDNTDLSHNHNNKQKTSQIKFEQLNNMHV